MDHGIGKLESGYNIVKSEEKVKTEEIKTDEDSYQADSAFNTLQTGFDGNRQKFAVISGGNTEKLLPCVEEVVESTGRERGIEDGKGIQAVSTDKPQCSLYDARSNKGRNRIPANHIQSGDQDESDGQNSMSARSIGNEDQSVERRDGEAILVSSGEYDHKEASAEDVMQLLHSIEGSLGPVMDSFRKFSTNTLRASTCCQPYKTLAKTFNKKISGVKELLFTAQSIVSQMKQPRESEPGSSEKDTNKDTEFKSASLKDKLQEESKNIPSCDLKMKSADQQDDSEPKCQSASADMPCSSLKNVGDGVDGLPDTGQHIDVYPRSGVDAKALVSLCNTLKEDLQNKDAVKGLQSMIEKTDVGDAGEIRNSKEGDVVDEIIVEALSHDLVAIQETKSPASLVSEKPSDGASGGFQDKSIGRDKYSQTQTQTEEVKKGPNLCQSFRRRDLPADISGDLEGRKLPFDECSNLEVRIKNFDSHEAANIKAKNRHSKPLHPLPSKDQAALSEDKKSLTNEDTSCIDIHSTSGTRSTSNSGHDSNQSCTSVENGSTTSVQDIAAQKKLNWQQTANTSVMQNEKDLSDQKEEVYPSASSLEVGHSPDDITTSKSSTTSGDVENGKMDEVNRTGLMCNQQAVLREENNICARKKALPAIGDVQNDRTDTESSAADTAEPVGSQMPKLLPTTRKGFVGGGKPEVKIKRSDIGEVGNIKDGNVQKKCLHSLSLKHQAILSEERKNLTNEDTLCNQIQSIPGIISTNNKRYPVDSQSGTYGMNPQSNKLQLTTRSDEGKEERYVAVKQSGNLGNKIERRRPPEAGESLEEGMGYSRKERIQKTVEVPTTEDKTEMSAHGQRSHNKIQQSPEKAMPAVYENQECCTSAEDGLSTSVQDRAANIEPCQQQTGNTAVVQNEEDWSDQREMVYPSSANSEETQSSDGITPSGSLSTSLGADYAKRDEVNPTGSSSLQIPVSLPSAEKGVKSAVCKAEAELSSGVQLQPSTTPKVMLSTDVPRNQSSSEKQGKREAMSQSAAGANQQSSHNNPPLHGATPFPQLQTVSRPTQDNSLSNSKVKPKELMKESNNGQFMTREKSSVAPELQPVSRQTVGTPFSKMCLLEFNNDVPSSSENNISPSAYFDKSEAYGFPFMNIIGKKCQHDSSANWSQPGSLNLQVQQRKGCQQGSNQSVHDKIHRPSKSITKWTNNLQPNYRKEIQQVKDLSLQGDPQSQKTRTTMLTRNGQSADVKKCKMKDIQSENSVKVDDPPTDPLMKYDPMETSHVMTTTDSKATNDVTVATNAKVSSVAMVAPPASTTASSHQVSPTKKNEVASGSHQVVGTKSKIADTKRYTISFIRETKKADDRKPSTESSHCTIRVHHKYGAYTDVKSLKPDDTFQDLCRLLFDMVYRYAGEVENVELYHRITGKAVTLDASVGYGYLPVCAVLRTQFVNRPADTKCNKKYFVLEVKYNRNLCKESSRCTIRVHHKCGGHTDVKSLKPDDTFQDLRKLIFDMEYESQGYCIEELQLCHRLTGKPVRLAASLGYGHVSVQAEIRRQPLINSFMNLPSCGTPCKVEVFDQAGYVHFLQCLSVTHTYRDLLKYLHQKVYQYFPYRYQYYQLGLAYRDTFKPVNLGECLGFEELKVTVVTF